ncbi:MAG: hypothetical protein J7K40_07695 [candidate division Zixibacteria bacterium]|nr:hypothetical protein [candidate division Zixibacteria bacterium]
MFNDARRIWPDFSTSAQQMDPVIHMMFKAMSNRLKEINDGISNISEIIIRDLACRIFFDGLLHPIPSSTILKYTTGASQTTIDQSTEACWTNTTVKPSVTFYLSPAESKTLLPIEAVAALSKNADGAHVLWTDPQWSGKNHLLVDFDTASVESNVDEKDCVYIALKLNGDDIKFPASDLFILSSPELLGILRWGRWRFTTESGIFSKPEFTVRENLKNIESKKVNPEISLWGHNYFPHEHIEEYSDCFFDIPKGAVGAPPLELRQSFSGQEDTFWDDFEPLYWIKIDSDMRITSDLINTFELAATNCLVAINSHFQKQNFFYHGPGAMSFQLQSPAKEIYEIISIADNRGRQYSNVYGAAAEVDAGCRYLPRINQDQLQMLIIPPEGKTDPDRFSVEFKTSAGQAANGIAAGNIDSLYNPHPGIETVINLTATKGGVNARTFDDMIAAFPHVLRSHNRAITSSDYESLTVTFDNRVKSAKAALGSTIRNGVVFRCVSIEVNVGGHKFEPAEESKLFLTRLQKFLEARSPMGTVVKAVFLR